jgi:hypothetical protein
MVARGGPLWQTVVGELLGVGVTMSLGARTRTRRVGALTVIGLAIAALLVTALPGGSASAGAPVLTAKVAAKKKHHHPKPPPAYHVPAGPIINSATGTKAQQYAIYNHITAAIQHAQPKSWIRIMTWNFMTRGGVNALTNAQKRGVVIRLIMSKANNDPSVGAPNPYYNRLQHNFTVWNKAHPKKPASFTKMCAHSCRGRKGEAHSKYYLFSHSGASKDVLMEGSANYTAAASLNQWNDEFTFVGRTKMFNYALGVYKQMWKDKPVVQAWQSRNFGDVTLDFSPELGVGWKSSDDPWRQILGQVKCTGATNGNDNHHTIIRLAPDVVRNDRGMELAHLLRGLWNQGCDVQMGYTVIAPAIKQYLESGSGRGPLPLVHLVQDFNQDGQFDNYFHLKVMTVNGVIGSNKAAFEMIDGSSNNSGLATASDENIAVIRRRGAVLKYQKFITYWIAHPPKYNTTHQIPPPDERALAGMRALSDLGTPPQQAQVHGWGVLPQGLHHDHPYAHVDQD